MAIPMQCNAANLSLVDDTRLAVASFVAVDDPDYSAAIPNPKVRINYAVTGAEQGRCT